ncbi:OsmC family protein [candidate division KSB1 bacterium]|nr:OsmC family protein [candidate division KSB1 bacterium]
MEARQVDASNKKLTAEVRGEVELEDNVLVIRRIHVLYRISATKEAKETIERVHSMHADYCPVYKSLHKAIEITTEYQLT